MTLKIQPESKTSTKTPSDWGDFDPIEYVTRNYGKILPEDRIIIQTVVTSFKNLSLRRAKLVADVGAGPNFYPAMLLASLIEEDAQIDLIEFSKPNQTFMKVLLDSPDGMYRNRNKLGKIQSMNTREPWQKFDKLIAELGGQGKFEQTLARARAAAKSIQGDIYSLPEATVWLCWLLFCGRINYLRQVKMYPSYKLFGRVCAARRGGYDSTDGGLKRLARRRGNSFPSSRLVTRTN